MKNTPKLTEITPEIEDKMRLMANLIIDRIFDDKKNQSLKFVPKKRVNQKGNTT